MHEIAVSQEKVVIKIMYFYKFASHKVGKTTEKTSSWKIGSNTSLSSRLLYNHY